MPSAATIVNATTAAMPVVIFIATRGASIASRSASATV